ncbi:MAG TPA: outer membrane beta-barrel protein [Draconibacterium sp.]|nr:outer membrane beta-barrel protein [Draconibacterium sp.]
MKKLLVILLMVANSYAFSQVVVQTAPQQTNRVVVVQKKAFTPYLRLNGYAFYAFDDRVDSYYSRTEYFNGKILGGFQWGGGLEYMMHPSQSIELSYLRLDTEAPIEYYDNRVKNTTFDVASNYILLGSNRYFTMNPKIEPYFGVQAGVAVFNVDNPDNGNSNNGTKFAWGAKLGLNIWANEKVGIKMQTGVISAVQAAGGGLYFGGGGVDAGVSTYSSFYQFYVGGGLTFKMGKN